MITLHGIWFDGRTSAKIKAACTVSDDGALSVTALADRRVLAAGPLAEVKASSRLGKTPRWLFFPAGEKFETDDNDAVDRILNEKGRLPKTTLLYRLESRWRFVLGALLILLVFFWGGARYGIPLLSKTIAFGLPASVNGVASAQTLKWLDRSLLGPSSLPEPVRSRLIRVFTPLFTDHPDYSLNVVFRAGGRIGPNAFALPDGTMVFTDEIVQLARHDDELLAILAHETGHVVHRHGMRRLIQDSILSFALLAVTGDVTGSSELFLGLPVLLTELAYSRAFEREADQYALDWLCNHGVQPVHFARLMRRLEEKSSSMETSGKRKWTGYLSTHPLTETRIRLFEESSPAEP